MACVLVGDIGGTHARLARVDEDGALRDVEVCRNDDFPSFEALIRAWLDARRPTGPLHAAFAVAAPITGDEVRWTNRPWSFSASDLARAFGFARLRVLNDFEAVAWALAGAGAGAVRPLGDDRPLGPGPRAVLGPGTGLGVAALVPTPNGWVALATEAGHAALPADDVAEFELFVRVAGGGRPTAEKLVSGPGLARLHAALGHGDIAPEAIVQAGLAGDPAARTTLERFARLLARFAADVALSLGARGGVAITGSIVRALRPVLDEVFRAAFEDHPSPAMHAWLRGVPTGMLDLPFAALHGCAAALGVETRVG